MLKRLRGQWVARAALAWICIVVVQPVRADRLVDDDAMRALARLAGTPACAAGCQDSRWTLRRLVLPPGRLQAGEAVYLAAEDVQGSCGSAGCAGAYLLREKQRLVLLGEGLGLGQGRRGTMPPGRIPNAAERARLPAVPLGR